MNPLKVKASATPITSANFGGLQPMTDAEVKNYIANVITEKFAVVTNGSGTAEINITTDNSGSGTSIGTFVDTKRTDAIGTHPTTGSTTSTTYYAKQVTSAASESITDRALKWEDTLAELSDSDIDSVMDHVIDAMVNESAYTAGQYKLQSTAPSGGTWVARYTITDEAQGGNTTTYLWQKTAATSTPDSDLTPIKSNDSNSIKQMTEAEIEQMLPNFRNRIIDTGVGTYKLQSTTPVVTGTWVQMGDTATDTRQSIAAQAYNGTVYSAQYSQGYTGTSTITSVDVVGYTGAYTRDFSGAYTNQFTNVFTGSYGSPVNYSGLYSGNYTKAFSGQYTNDFSRTSAGTYNQQFTRQWAGQYTNQYTGSFSGNYSSSYTGSYSGNYSRLFSGTYSKQFSGSYSGAYTGEYSRLFTGTYDRGFSGQYANLFAGQYTGDFSRTSANSFSRAWSGTYSSLVAYSGQYTGEASFAGDYTGVDPEPTWGGGPVTTNYAAYYTGDRFFGQTFTAPAYTGPAYSGPETQYNTQTIVYQGFTEPGPTTFVEEAPGEGGPTLPAFYSGPQYSGSISYQGVYQGGPYTVAYSGEQSFVRQYSGVLVIPYSGVYSSPAVYAGSSIGDTPYSGDYSNSYSNLFTGVYSRQFTGQYGNQFVGTYTGSFTGDYANTFTRASVGTYAGAFAGFFTGDYAGTFVGSYDGVYGGTYAGTYNQQFTRQFTGLYTNQYTGSFTGDYSGVYSRQFAGSFDSSFAGSYAGTYAGTGSFSGDYTNQFTRQFTGLYSRQYSGAYGVGSTYSTTVPEVYTKQYTKGFTSTYTALTVQATKDTVSSVKLWIRTA